MYWATASKGSRREDNHIFVWRNHNPLPVHLCFSLVKMYKSYCFTTPRVAKQRQLLWNRVVRVELPPCSRFSTHSAQMPSKAFPSYTIYGPTGALVFKPLPPQFKIAQPSGGLVLAQKGKMAVELVPRNNSSTQHAWKQAIRYLLSPEDVGLILNALPSQEVELSMRLALNDDSENSEQPFFPVNSSDSGIIDRVLKLSPASSGASIHVSIDFVRDGVGGVLLPPNLQRYGTPPSSHPLTIEMQAGEWIIVKALLEYSIPHLLGWTNMLSLNNTNSIIEAQNPNGTRNNNFFGNRAKGYSADMPPSFSFDEYNQAGGTYRDKQYPKRSTSKISTSDDDDHL